MMQATTSLSCPKLATTSFTPVGNEADRIGTAGVRIMTR
jgi:hypothetical protein